MCIAPCSLLRLPEALRDHGSRDNIILQPGDSIRIPEYRANGEVRTRHGSFLFSSNPAPGPGSEVFVPSEGTVAIIVIATR
jgi:hypothetical protein